MGVRYYRDQTQKKSERELQTIRDLTRCTTMADSKKSMKQMYDSLSMSVYMHI
jgi:hypothetical protein